MHKSTYVGTYSKYIPQDHTLQLEDSQSVPHQQVELQTVDQCDRKICVASAKIEVYIVNCKMQYMILITV